MTISVFILGLGLIVRHVTINVGHLTYCVTLFPEWTGMLNGCILCRNHIFVGYVN